MKLFKSLINNIFDRLNINLFRKINKELNTNYKSNQEIEWYYISKYYQLSEDFIDRYSKYVFWDEICRYQKLSEEFIEKHKDDVSWANISIYQILSEKFMEDNRDELYWYYLCFYQKMSENFIEKWKDYVNWFNVAIYQHLSEEFIKKHFAKLGFENISKFQNLSIDFIDSHKEKLNLYFLATYQRLNEKMRKYACDNESENFIEKLINENWIYKSTEEKKQAVIDTGLYECHEDYFVGYKAIRNDRYSFHSFQYKYEKGGVYESWCDCSNDENSFGLNTGTKDFANKYGSIYDKYMVVRCKVKYEDVGRVVHDGQKIRCFKIEIMD